MNVPKALMDTNILVYAWNTKDPRKQDKAITTLQHYQHQSYLTTQNVTEFSAVMLRNGCTPDWIKDTLMIYERLMTILPLTTNHVKEALRGVKEYRMSFWDAQIWAVAKSHQITIIITEDGPTGQIIEDVQFVNPFNS